LNKRSEIDDHELIRRCIVQDRHAQKELYEKYANDILQESFIEIFGDLKNFRGESGLFGWMKTIVYRKSLLHLKIESKFINYDNDKHDEQIVWRDDLTTEFLDKAIRELPDGYRAVFLLAEVDGYKHKEIAEMMGIAEGTSKSQLYHAKKLLQKMLHELKP
jgi:RNA polymerase sigma factor (sigma-70 family)